MKVASSKVMKKNIISLPKIVREVLELKPGDYVEWFIENKKVVLRKERRI
ncbi:MAG: AbrB/MazE/SpoVT family DNA-binding domain-containing protein [Archaeoglobales archaeon]|nr:AbrB/MazE/SpoVT family DNA-binding domain-containing protein [Archaeoglobales archaeon]